MATLTGKTIAGSYKDLLKINANAYQSGVDGTLRAIEDGDATASALWLATDSALISGDGNKLYFYDADGDEHISADASGVLSIAAGAEIDLTATAVDLNGTLDVSGTLTVGGNIDFNSGTIDLSTQTVTVELNQAADSFTFDGAADNILSINASNNRIGIGTNSPDGVLHIESNQADVSRTMRFTHKSTTIGLNDVIGRIEFEGLDTGSPGLMGSISCTAADADGRGQLLFATGAGGGEATRMTIDSSGNVGIGTAAPSRQLTVENTLANSGGVIGLTSSDSSSSGTCGIIHFGNSTDSSLASINGIADGATDAGALLFKTEATGGSIEERMRIDSSGNVGIGASPSLDVGSGLEITNASRASLQLESTGADSLTTIVMKNDTNSWHINGAIGSSSNELGIYSGGLSGYVMTLLNDGSVGIGTDAPAEKVHIVGTGDNTEFTALRLYNDDWASGETGQTVGIDFTLNRGNATEKLAGKIVVGKDDDFDNATAADSHMKFYTTISNTSTERMRIDSSGDVTFTGDLIMADGKGINFAAMTSPADATGMAAETLKDYEEGTWTAAIAANSGTITIANFTGYYTKIGNQVFFKGRFTVGGISAPSGDLSITGLPFTSANPAGDAANTIGAVYFENSVNELTSNIIGLVPDNSTYFFIRRSGATSSGNDLADDVDAGTVLLVSGNYWT